MEMVLIPSGRLPNEVTLPSPILATRELKLNRSPDSPLSVEACNERVEKSVIKKRQTRGVSCSKKSDLAFDSGKAAS